MCVHDAEDDSKLCVFFFFKNVKYKFKFFWSSNFLLVGGCWLVSDWCI